MTCQPDTLAIVATVIAFLFAVAFTILIVAYIRKCDKLAIVDVLHDNLKRVCAERCAEICNLREALKLGRAVIVDCHGQIRAVGSQTIRTKVHHSEDCNGECGGMFMCSGCHQIVGYCMGAADEHPELCDGCSHKEDLRTRLKDSEAVNVAGVMEDLKVRVEQEEPEDGEERVG